MFVKSIHLNPGCPSRTAGTEHKLYTPDSLVINAKQLDYQQK